MSLGECTKLLPLGVIRRDGGTQPRTEIDAFTVDEYAGAMKAGERFPPVTVFQDGSVFWLADGFHRVGGAERAGLQSIEVEVREGSLVEAQWYALAANKTNGLRRSREDKRRAVLLALQHPNSKVLSPIQIAVHVGVSDQFVRNVRREVGDSQCLELPETTVGRDGKSRPVVYQSLSEQIAPDVRTTLGSLPTEVSRRHLELLAQSPPEKQRLVADHLSSGRSRSVRDALRQIQYEVVTPSADVPTLPAKGIYYAGDDVTLYQGDCGDVLDELPAESVNTCVTSPPYWKQFNYDGGGNLGHEANPAEYVANFAVLMDKVRRVLRPDGSAWVNLGSTFMTAAFEPLGLKVKDEATIPHRVAIELVRRGWFLRSEIVWDIPNGAPESATDRPTRSHQFIFLVTKAATYHYDIDAVREPVSETTAKRVQLANSRRGVSSPTPGPASRWRIANKSGHPADRLFAIPHPLGRNRRSVWQIPNQGSAGSGHPAPFPPDLVRPCILAGCPKDGVVLDPFMGSGTVAVVARELGRRSIGIDLSARYCEMSVRRLKSSESGGSTAGDRAEVFSESVEEGRRDDRLKLADGVQSVPGDST